MEPETAVALGCQVLWLPESSVPTGLVLGPFWLSLLKFLWRLGSTQESATILLLHFLLSTVTRALSGQFISRPFFLSTLDALRPCKKKKKVQLGKSSGDQKAGCVPFANSSSEAESETGTSLLSTKRSSRKHCSPLKEVLKNQNSKAKIHQSVGKAFRIVKVSKAEERSLYGVGTKRWRHVWLISTLRHT